MKNYFIYVVLLLTVFLSCDNNNYDVVIDQHSKLDKMFIDGFDMKLEQVYLMNGEHTIPFLDKPKDSAFKQGVNTISITEFTDYGTSTNRDTLLKRIVRDEQWSITPMHKTTDTIHYETGFGSNYTVRMVTINHTNNFIIRGDKVFSINIKIDNNYNYRGNDNHLFMVENIRNNTVYKSNLYFEVLTKDGLALFHDGKYIYFDTSNIFTFSRLLTPPLTADKVREEIANGNYTLYLYNGMTTYKIGDNLYIPRFNSYIYVGTINTNGMVINLESKYYRFKFRIV